MTGWQYLKQILTKEQMQAVRFAKKYGYTIIVSGPQGPTGKTTVTLVLTLVIKHFGIEDINHYESSCLFMLMYLCVSRLLEEG